MFPINVRSFSWSLKLSNSINLLGEKLSNFINLLGECCGNNDDL